MKRYLEISISATPEQQELLLPAMLEIGCTGFQETDTALLCYMTAGPAERDLQGELRKLLHTLSSNAAIAIREIENRNWNEEWEKTIRPIEVGRRFVITPSWAEYGGSADRIVVRIDPKMSFGTGYHETTRLVLLLLEKFAAPGMEVLDVGTGTGILAIAAVKLGARRVLATDIDEWALLNARENVATNDAAGVVTVSDEPAGSLAAASVDLITANLTLDTNRELLPDFRRVLRRSGMLIVSGLLAGDREPMLSALAACGFAAVDEARENEWIAIAAGPSA
jgi:ribosomal protein L11 methyltransferase